MAETPERGLAMLEEVWNSRREDKELVHKMVQAINANFVADAERFKMLVVHQLQQFHSTLVEDLRTLDASSLTAYTTAMQRVNTKERPTKRKSVDSGNAEAPPPKKSKARQEKQSVSLDEYDVRFKGLVSTRYSKKLDVLDTSAEARGVDALLLALLMPLISDNRKEKRRFPHVIGVIGPVAVVNWSLLKALYDSECIVPPADNYPKLDLSLRHFKDDHRVLVSFRRLNSSIDGIRLFKSKSKLGGTKQRLIGKMGAELIWNTRLVEQEVREIEYYMPTNIVEDRQVYLILPFDLVHTTFGRLSNTPAYNETKFPVKFKSLPRDSEFCVLYEPAEFETGSIDALCNNLLEWMLEDKPVDKATPEEKIDVIDEPDDNDAAEMEAHDDNDAADREAHDDNDAAEMEAPVEEESEQDEEAPEPEPYPPTPVCTVSARTFADAPPKNSAAALPLSPVYEPTSRPVVMPTTRLRTPTPEKHEPTPPASPVKVIKPTDMQVVAKSQTAKVTIYAKPVPSLKHDRPPSPLVMHDDDKYADAEIAV